MAGELGVGVVFRGRRGGQLPRWDARTREKTPGTRRQAGERAAGTSCCLLLAACCLLLAWCLVLGACLLLAACCSVLGACLVIACCLPLATGRLLLRIASLPPCSPAATCSQALLSKGAMSNIITMHFQSRMARTHLRGGSVLVGSNFH